MGWRAAFIALITALLCAAPAQAANYTVTGTGDGGTCSGTTCPSIRAAIAAAELTTGADAISVPAGVVNIANDLVINSAITIIGASARTTIIDGGDKYRGFRISGEGSLQLARFTIRNGSAGGGGFTDGGGIYNAGNLNIIDVRVTGSRAARGGGIANNLGVFQGDNLLVDNNSASGAGGGGIHNTGGPELAGQDGWMFLTDTTIFQNSATGISGVGGIDSSGTGALITLSRTTIADNLGGTRGVGGFSPTGSTAAVGTILARNLVGASIVNCGDTKPIDSGFNVEDERDCNLAPGAMKPELATALSNQGGQLDVLTITTDSDAFNILPGANEACTGTDQRALARPKGGSCEAGAFELNAGASVRITEGPTGTVTSNDVEFRFQDSGGDVTVQCDLTGPGQTAGFETCYKSNAQPYTDLPDGPYTFSVRAISAEFPTPPVTTRTFVVNEAGPPNTTITGGPTGLTNDPTPTFTFTSTEQGSSFQCRVGATAGFAACTSPHTLPTQTDGAKTFEVRAIDAAGAADPTPAARSFTVDATAPDTTIGSGPTGPTASTSATFTFTSNEPGATFQCALDGAAFGACPVSYTGLAQGSHTFQVRATDTAGNVDASPASRTWTVDTVAPDTTIATGPSGNVASTSATFTFTSNEAGATFQCALDGAAFGACPAGYTGLAQGSHTLQVRAVDTANNQDASPASRTWTVDTVAPDTTIATGPSGNVASTSATFTFTSNEAGATFQCALDGAAFAACPAGYTGLAQGSHTFQVRATDTAGNVDASPASRTWTVDTVAPDTTIATGPSGNVASTSANFTFTSNEAGATFQCALDGAAFAACPAGYTGLAQGSHTFQVRATDTAGNVDASPASRTWTVDTVAPNTTIATGPSGNVASTSANFTFTSNEAGATFQCALDGAAFAACPAGYTGLAQGSHTFQVRAVDTAGNQDATPASRTWTVDTQAAAAPVITAPTANQLFSVSTINVVGTAEPNATVALTEGVSSLGSSPSSGTGAWNVNLTSVPDGTHTYTARTIDAAGNQSPATTRTFRVDTTRPDTTVVSGPSGVTNDTTPTWGFSSNESPVTYLCSVDGATASACPNPFTTSTLAPGLHTLSVRAVDEAGNIDSTPATRSITVDTTAPTVTITSGPPARTNDTTPTFLFNADANATVQCRIDTGTFANCTSGYTPTVTVEGSHTFEVRATTPAGNSATDTWSFITDTTAPNTTITDGPEPSSGDTSPQFTFTSTEAGTFQCSLDGAAFTGCNSPHSPGTLALGEHTYRVRAIDLAGNTDATPASQTFTIIDTVAPSAPTIENATAGGSTVTLSGKAEAGATVEIVEGAAVVGSTTADASTNWTLTLAVVPDGSHTYAARARDAADNQSGASAPRTVVVDTAPPPAPEVQGPNGAISDPNPAFTFAATEPTVECRLDRPSGVGAYAACLSPKTFDALAPGAYEFFVRVTDAAGNQTETRRAFTIVQLQAAQTPTPTPSATPAPPPTPVPNQTIVVTPAKVGTVLVKEKGASKFEPLDVTKGIKNGSEVDVRNGRVTLTSIPKVGAPPETADFYGGIFIVTQKGGITDLKLSERLTGCPKGQQASLSLAQKKPKSRKLWGNGKGAFRTSGKYSAATVRGTIWLVQDSCTTTLTRVTQGVVQVNDFVKKKKQLVKKGKRYTAKAKKR